MLRGMGVVVTLEINGRVISLPYPSGGEFNAAGDFDRLLPVSPDLVLLGRIDPYGNVKFGSSDMAAIHDEAEGLVGLARGRSGTPGPTEAPGTRSLRQPNL